MKEGPERPLRKRCSKVADVPLFSLSFLIGVVDISDKPARGRSFQAPTEDA